MHIVVKTIQRFMGLPESVITDEAHLVDDLGADSITLHEIMSALEAHYNKEIEYAELGDIKTVRDIKDLVDKYELSNI